MIGNDLYHKISEWLQDRSIHLYTNLSKSDILPEFNKLWTRYFNTTRSIDHIFDYLNRYWIRNQKDLGRNVYNIREISCMKFYENIFLPSRDLLLTCFFDYTQRIRQHYLSDMNDDMDSFISLNVKTFVSAIHTMSKNVTQYEDVFLNHFENPYRSILSQTFTRSANDIFQVSQFDINSISDCITQVTRIIQIETEHIIPLMPSFDLQKLEKLLNDALISPNIHILDQGFIPLLSACDNSLIPLSKCYSLILRLPSHEMEAFRRRFEEFIISYVSKQWNVEIISSLDIKTMDPKSFIKSINDMHRYILGICTQAFHQDTSFTATLDKAFRYIIDQIPKAPEILARYCDQVMRKDVMSITQEQIDSFYHETILIFKYTENKDIFQGFYINYLAKRLVTEASANQDMELAMIGNLKDLCGIEYANKLSRMFSDVSISKELKDVFQKTDSGTIKTFPDFNPMVLSAGSWPLSSDPSTLLTLPEQMAAQIEAFETFHKKRHTGRKLQWLYGLCRGEIQAKFPRSNNGDKNTSTTYTFNASLFQMMILMLFSNQNSGDLSVEEIQKSLGIPHDQLMNTIIQLIQVNLLILSNGSIDEISLNSVVSLNINYSNSKIKVNINIPPKVEQKKDVEDTFKTIEEDRKMLIQAAIVRIMKANQIMKHVILVGDVISCLSNRFKPSISDIKKCIDILIEKEYLERQADNPEMIRYVA